MAKSSSFGLGLRIVLLAAVCVTEVRAQTTQDLRFRVLLNDKEIGFHHFRVANRNGLETVDISADFDVRFFAIPVYRYDHRNREVWNKGCLEKIESVTDDNGNEFRVDGRRNAKRFEISTQSERFALDSECVMTFAYWNPDFLRQSNLLNAQTGEYLPIQIEAGGAESLRFGVDIIITAERFNLRNSEQGIDISIWYRADNGRWLALESRVDGRVIRYLPAEYKLASRGGVPRWLEK